MTPSLKLLIKGQKRVSKVILIAFACLLLFSVTARIILIADMLRQYRELQLEQEQVLAYVNYSALKDGASRFG